MRFFVIALISLLFWGTLSAIAEEKPFRICYFSLNNEKEFEETKKFAEKLNQYSSRKIIVTEHQDPKGGVNTNQSFKKFVESGTECDGLVISGHHTGSWGGKRSSGGQLSISFMEELACDPKHKAWFERIHALWLQGCRTLGVGEIRAEEAHTEAVSADFHTQRVGEVLREDHLQQGFQDLNIEFSATLDQDNPLSSRYLRLFPRSTVFGWTRTAPGSNAKSEYSLPYHMAHIARKISKEENFPEDPIAPAFTLETADKYLMALQVAIGGLGGERSGCEDVLVESWLDHGNVLKVGGYGFNNPDLNAHKALQNNPNPFFDKAKELDCLFRQVKDRNTLFKAVDVALKNRQSIGLSFNSLFEAMQRLKREGNLPLLAGLQKKLQDSQELQAFLEGKLMSKQLGVLRKIDYYAFYKEIQGKGFNVIEEEIRKTALSQLSVPMRGATDYDRIDYRETLMQSLSKHGLVDHDFIFAILQIPNLDENHAKLVARAIGDSKYPIENASQLLKDIVASPKAESDTLRYVAYAIVESKHSIENVSQVLKDIVASPKAESDTLGTVVGAIIYSLHPIENASQLLKDIVASPKVGPGTLRSVALTIKESKYPIENASQLLKDIVASPKADSDTLRYVADAIRNSDNPITNKETILKALEERRKQLSR